VVAGGVDRYGGAGAVAGGGVDLVVGVINAGAGFGAELRWVRGGQRDGDGLVRPVTAGVDAGVGRFRRRRLSTARACRCGAVAECVASSLPALSVEKYLMTCPSLLSAGLLAEL